MSDYRDIEKEALEKGILLDKCGLIDRYYDFGSYQDFCGMTPQEILENMRQAGQGGGGGSQKASVAITATVVSDGTNWVVKAVSNTVLPDQVTITVLADGEAKTMTMAAGDVEETSPWTVDKYAVVSATVSPSSSDKANYKITITNPNGDGTKNVSVKTYKDGDMTSVETISAKAGKNVSIDIVELADCDFDNWEVNGVTGETDPLEFVMPDEDNLEVKIYYEIKTLVVRFLNYDGSVIETTTTKYNTIPSYSGEEPTRPSDAQYIYSFNGWDKPFAQITENTDYTATYAETLREYDITWVDEDGVLKRYYDWADNKYPWREDLWNSVQGRAANWNDAIKDPRTGEPIIGEHGNWVYTSDGTVSGVPCERCWLGAFNAPEATFPWIALELPRPYEGIVEVVYKGETTVYPWGDAVKLFKNGFGCASIPNELGMAYLKSDINGDPADGNEEHRVVKEDLQITLIDAEGNEVPATWHLINNEASWLAAYSGHCILDVTSVPYGEIPTHEDPVKPATKEWTYTFDQWTPTPVAVTGPATYTASYNAEKNAYTVTWDISGRTETESLDFGTMPTHADPESAHTPEYDYTFDRWDPLIERVTGDKTYTAIFNESKNSYTIAFKNYDGTVLQSSVIEYGVMPVYSGEEPTKDSDPQYDYTFNGWDSEIVAVTEDKDYVATFSATTRSYDITWVDEDSVLKRYYDWADNKYPWREDLWNSVQGRAANWNDAIKDPRTGQPIVGEHGNWVYTSDGTVSGVPCERCWLGAFNAPEATFPWIALELPRPYEGIVEVVYKGETTVYPWGDEVKLFKNGFGCASIPNELSMPELKSDINGDPADGNEEHRVVKEDLVITLIDASGNTTPATWHLINNEASWSAATYNVEHCILDVTSVPYGEMPTHDDPVKPATKEWTYSFSAWTPEIVPVTGPATYQANYSAEKNQYVVTWNISGESEEETLDFGVMPTHADPESAHTPEYDYTFDRWDPLIERVTGNTTYTAMYNVIPNSYSVLINNIDSEKMDVTVNGQPYDQSEVYPYNSEVTIVAEIKNEYKPEYHFVNSGDTWSDTLIIDEVNEITLPNLVKDTYTVTLIGDPSKVVLSGSGEYDYGTLVEISAEPLSGYTFNYWSDGVTASTREITVTGDTELEAVVSEPSEKLVYWGEVNINNLDALGKTFSVNDLQTALSGSTDPSGIEGDEPVAEQTIEYHYISTNEDKQWYDDYVDEEIDDIDYYNYLVTSGNSKYFIFAVPSEHVITSIVNAGLPSPVSYEREDGYKIDGNDYSIVKIAYANSPKSIGVYPVDKTYWNKYTTNGVSDDVTKKIIITMN